MNAQQFIPLFVIVLVILAVFAVTRGRAQNDNSSPTKVEGEPTTTDSGLQYWVIQAGTGDTATAGNRVRVHYTGWLTNGKKFDSSVDRGRPFEFSLGAGR